MIEILGHFKKRKIFVIGDFMLDSYTRGSVKRISPEAPVCVLKVTKEDSLPGGAGNVVLNCVSLGAQVYAAGRFGDDKASSMLISLLQNKGVDTSFMVYEEGYETPLKNRVLAEYQQLLRIDFEKDLPVLSATEKKLLENLTSVLDELDLVLISDYNKGLLSKNLLSGIIFLAKSRNIPVFVDPKGRDFSKYLGATLIKPNLSEAYLASGLEDKASLDDVAAAILSKSNAQYLLITRSEKGMSLFDQNGRTDFAAMAKEVIDVTGAGDTVISTLSVAISSGISLENAVILSNLAASIAIEKLGCVHVTKKELVKAIIKQDKKFKWLPHLGASAGSLIFDEEKAIHISLEDHSLDFTFSAKLDEIKKQNPGHLICVIVPDDIDRNCLDHLLCFNAIDLLLPKSYLDSNQLIEV